jgi:hypothetical protein
MLLFSSQVPREYGIQRLFKQNKKDKHMIKLQEKKKQLKHRHLRIEGCHGTPQKTPMELHIRCMKAS